MSIDTAYSTSDRNVGKVILHNGSAVSRTAKPIHSIPLNTTVINTPTSKDRLTNISLNTHSLELMISGKKGYTELIVTKTPSNFSDYKDNTIFDIPLSKQNEFDYLNYKNKGLQDEHYNTRINVKCYNVGLPVVIYTSKDNTINYPSFSLKGYDISESLDKVAITKSFNLNQSYIKKNSNSVNVPMSIMNIISSISYSFGNYKFNPYNLPSTTINVNRQKNSWTTNILTYDKCIITTVKDKPKVELQIPGYGSSVVFDVQKQIDFITSEKVENKEIDTIKFVVQKDSFIELYIKFTSNIITDAVGLPDGMFLDGNYIKGSPTLAGIYNIKLMCYEDVIMECIIEVPNIPRKF